MANAPNVTTLSVLPALAVSKTQPNVVFANVLLAGAGAAAPTITDGGGIASSVTRAGVGVYQVRLNCRAQPSTAGAPMAFVYAQLVNDGAVPAPDGWTVILSKVEDATVSGTVVNVVNVYLFDATGAAADLTATDAYLSLLFCLVGGPF